MNILSKFLSSFKPMNKVSIKVQQDRVEIDNLPKGGRVFVNGEEAGLNPKPKSPSFKTTWGYDRQSILRGEWNPGLSYQYYFIDHHGEVRSSASADFYFKLRNWNNGTKFFPTQQDAEEYKSIADGKWFPKEGDDYWAIERSTGFLPSRMAASMCYHLYPKFRANWIFFPSERQRELYLEAQKPKLPTAHELQRAYNKDAASDAVAKAINGGAHELGEGMSRFLRVAMKSRFIANLIRVAEKGMGGVSLDWHVFKNMAGSWEAGACGATGYPGRERFHTKAGAKLYMEAMGAGLEYLL